MAPNMLADMAAKRLSPRGLYCSMLFFILAVLALFSGLFPLILGLGPAAGGVLETGQLALSRWWLGGGGALLALLLLSWRWPGRVRLYWLALMGLALLSSVALFMHLAGGKDGVAVPRQAGAPPVARVGIVTALPLFWSGNKGVADLMRGEGRAPAPLTHHRTEALDYIDPAYLQRLDAVLIAQPRLLQPEELVALDDWVRSGGKALFFADPLLLWPSDVSLADPRRPPLTSLLDPLLSHWGLRLEAARAEGAQVERRRLSSGHRLMVAGASHFTLTGQGAAGAQCQLAEAGLMALCRVGRGQARLVADADVLDERLWLADPAHPGREEAWSADIPALLDSWLLAPLAGVATPAPLRVADERALAEAMRAAMAVLLAWAGMGWLGHRRLFRLGEAGKQASA